MNSDRREMQIESQPKPKLVAFRGTGGAASKNLNKLHNQWQCVAYTTYIGKIKIICPSLSTYENDTGCISTEIKQSGKFALPHNAAAKDTRDDSRYPEIRPADNLKHSEVEEEVLVVPEFPAVNGMRE